MDERSGYYDALDAYEEEIGGRSANNARYLPSPGDIEQRITDLRWLQEQGFNQRFIASVLQFDTPTLDVVVKMVKRHGPFETYKRLRIFLAPTEYDLECPDTPDPE